MPNLLQYESSPYLLQHAYNPVQWQPYGPDALAQARQQDKPILLSIGYSSCHWCHVMEHESFENEVTASLMNANFINIKVDREERPDIDHLYMDALQAMTGSGGWPLNIFLTPDLKPFYGGTYFPTRPAHGRPSWNDVLLSIADAYKSRRDEISKQASSIYEWLKNENLPKESLTKSDNELSAQTIFDKIFNQLASRFDKVNGGFERAPKFLGTMSLRLLLRYHHYTHNLQALEHVTLSLNKMLQGGIYDHIGGGISRYSTDERWLVPHFEKMLYDQALLLTVLAEAYMAIKSQVYLNAIAHIIKYINDEMRSAEGGFYSALDADSEGHEGKYYTWPKSEIETLLASDTELFCEFYGISDNGNWHEGNYQENGEMLRINILNECVDKESFCKKHNLSVDKLDQLLRQAKEKLLTKRKKRIPPLLDDKILLGWNALMNEALSTSYQASGQKQYLQMAIDNMRFIEEHYYVDGEWRHTYKNGEAKHLAFLDDLSYLLSAYITLYESSFVPSLLNKALALVAYIFTNYSDASDTHFYYTSAQQNDILLRKKELYDGAVPSGNSTLCSALLKLGRHTQNTSYSTRAIDMLNKIQAGIMQYPTSFSNWGMALSNSLFPATEIGVLGPNALELGANLNMEFIPNKIIAAASQLNEHPLLANKKLNNETLIYKCSNYECKMPVKTIEEFMAL